MSGNLGNPSGPRGAKVDRAGQPDAAMQEARAVVRGIAEEARQGHVAWDGGPDAERLRGLAFRVMFLNPLRRLARRCRSAIVARAAKRSAGDRATIRSRARF
jgi:hypothetical protein